MQFLGQHFLKNETAINKTIAALDIKSGDLIIEIGPGKGALTLPMAQSSNTDFKIITIEKDIDLAKELDKKIRNLHIKNTEIIEGDILKVLPELIEKAKIKNYKLIGNLPYYITGKILRMISDLTHKPIISILMVQKEVAERISGKPPHNNLLAAATHIWAGVETVLTLKAKDFVPPPKVDSAVIKLTTNDLQPTTKGKEGYYKLIHIIFKQPRKTLANNLKDGLGITREEVEKYLNSLKIPINYRPQDISTEQILQLSQLNII